MRKLKLSKVQKFVLRRRLQKLKPLKLGEVRRGEHGLKFKKLCKRRHKKLDIKKRKRVN